MTVARRRGDAGKADRLFSLIVRSRGACEYPGCESVGPFDTAHIIGRRYSATRCDERNAWCLCRTHHSLVDNWFDEKRMLVERTIGEDVFTELRRMAERGTTTSSALFWQDTAARMMARCAELGIDTRRSAA